MANDDYVARKLAELARLPHREPTAQQVERARHHAAGRVRLGDGTVVRLN